MDPSFVRSLLSEVRSAFVRSFVRLLRLLRLLRSFASFRFVCFVCFVCFVHLLRLPHLLRSSVRSLLRHFVCLLRSFVCFTRSFVLKMSPSVVASFFVLFSPFVRSFSKRVASLFVPKFVCLLHRSLAQSSVPLSVPRFLPAFVRPELARSFGRLSFPVSLPSSFLGQSLSSFVPLSIASLLLPTFNAVPTSSVP